MATSFKSSHACTGELSASNLSGIWKIQSALNKQTKKGIIINSNKNGKLYHTKNENFQYHKNISFSWVLISKIKYFD